MKELRNIYGLWVSCQKIFTNKNFTGYSSQIVVRFVKTLLYTQVYLLLTLAGSQVSWRKRCWPWRGQRSLVAMPSVWPGTHWGRRGVAHCCGRASGSLGCKWGRRGWQEENRKWMANDSFGIATTKYFLDNKNKHREHPQIWCLKKQGTRQTAGYTRYTVWCIHHPYLFMPHTYTCPIHTCCKIPV